MNVVTQKIKNIGGRWFLAAAGMAAACNAAAVDTVDGLELLDTMGKYSQDLHVMYAKRPGASDLDGIIALSEKLGRLTGVVFDTETFLADEDRIGLGSSQDKSASFEVDRATGNFLFNGGLDDYRKDASTPNLPGAKEAVYLAEKLILELGLPADPREMVISHVGGWNMAVTYGKGDSTTFEKLKSVRYSRILDGLTVEGDGRITVQFGENGKTASLIYQWPEIAKAERLDASTLEDARSLQEHALERIQSVTDKALKATLSKVDLVLYDDGRGVMEPAYHLVVERYFDYGDLEPVMIPYDFFVPTTVNPRAFYPYMDVGTAVPSADAYASKL